VKDTIVWCTYTSLLGPIQKLLPHMAEQPEPIGTCSFRNHGNCPGESRSNHRTTHHHLRYLACKKLPRNYAPEPPKKSLPPSKQLAKEMRVKSTHENLLRRSSEGGLPSDNSYTGRSGSRISAPRNPSGVGLSLATFFTSGQDEDVVGGSSPTLPLITGDEAVM
jgi:hypothetical protein